MGGSEGGWVLNGGWVGWGRGSMGASRRFVSCVVMRKRDEKRMDGRGGEDESGNENPTFCRICTSKRIQPHHHHFTNESPP